MALYEAECHLCPAQAHERDDWEKAAASLIKAASYLRCFDKTWNSPILTDHLMNNQNPSAVQSAAGTISATSLARSTWGEQGKILRRALKPTQNCFIPGRGQGRFWGARFWSRIEIMLLNILHQSCLENTTVASGTSSHETESFCDSYLHLQDCSYVPSGEKVLSP